MLWSCKTHRERYMRERKRVGRDAGRTSEWKEPPRDDPVWPSGFTAREMRLRKGEQLIQGYTAD